MPMWFNNIESLEQVLRSAFNEGATDRQRPYWHLMYELMILQGKMAEFEELGLEFAMAFEESPPPWESYVNTVAAAASLIAGFGLGQVVPLRTVLNKPPVAAPSADFNRPKTIAIAQELPPENDDELLSEAFTTPKVKNLSALDDMTPHARDYASRSK